MSRMEVYKPDEIIHVINLLETAQDILMAQGEYLSDEIYDMLQEAIIILCYEDGEE
jgi:hypothetical protein